MFWYEVSVHTSSFGSDLVADTFLELGLSGVVIVDRNDLQELMQDRSRWDYIDESFVATFPKDALVKGYWEEEWEKDRVTQVEKALQELKQTFPGVEFGSLQMQVEKVSDDGWLDGWRQYYQPIELGKIVIIPKWIAYDPQGKIPVYLDPGIAFGTGDHATTQKCILAMQEVDVSGAHVLDMGCGSGILGITALKAGACDCCSVDINLSAVKMTKVNAGYNDITDEQLHICLGDMSQDEKLKDKIYSQRYDIIFANIVADVILLYAADFYRLLKPNGYLITSGIIDARVEEVQQKLLDLGFVTRKKYNQDEWNCLLMEKRETSKK